MRTHEEEKKKKTKAKAWTHVTVQVQVQEVDQSKVNEVKAFGRSEQAVREVVTKCVRSVRSSILRRQARVYAAYSRIMELGGYVVVMCSR